MPKAIFFSKLQQEECNHSITVLPESAVKTSCRESVHRRESPVSRNTNSRRPQTKTTGSHQWERPETSSRQEDRAAQMQSVVHRQPPNHPQPKLSGNVSSIAVQSVPTGVCTSRTSLYSQQQACKMTLNLPGPYQWEISHLLLYSVHLQHFEHPDTFTSL